MICERFSGVTVSVNSPPKATTGGGGDCHNVEIDSICSGESQSRPAPFVDIGFRFYTMSFAIFNDQYLQHIRHAPMLAIGRYLEHFPNIRANSEINWYGLFPGHLYVTIIA